LRAERKKLQSELDALAKRLAALSPKALEGLELDAELKDAIRTLATMPKGPAIARQRRHVARSLRAYDLAELTQKIDETLGDHTRDAQAHALERWRTRLLEEGDAAMAELVAAHPEIDRQRLRQAVRAAAAEEKKGARGRRYKALYQLLRDELPFGDPS
jgi:ribosome-associated protein